MLCQPVFKISPALTRSREQKKEVTRIYRLTFDDDEGAIRDVPIELVCDPTPL